MQLPHDAIGWQKYIDTSFPDGVQFNWIDPSDNSLIFPSRMLSTLKVVKMNGSWPVLAGFDFLQEDYDCWIYVVEWKETPRHGHFVARAFQDEAPAVELSSWIDEKMVALLAQARPEDENALTVIADSMALVRDA